MPALNADWIKLLVGAGVGLMGVHAAYELGKQSDRERAHRRWAEESQRQRAYQLRCAAGRGQSTTRAYQRAMFEFADY